MVNMPNGGVLRCLIIPKPIGGVSYGSYAYWGCVVWLLCLLGVCPMVAMSIRGVPYG